VVFENVGINQTLNFGELGGNKLVTVGSFKHLSLSQNIRVVLGASSDGVVAVKDPINANAIKSHVLFVNYALHSRKIKIVVWMLSERDTLLDGFELTDKGIHMRMQNVGRRVRDGV
jgi:hypothetical protein